MLLSNLLWFVTFAAAAVAPECKCNQDACYKSITSGNDPKGDCSKSLVKTVTGPVITKKTTVTITKSATSISTYTIGTVTTTASALPIAARAAECCDAAGRSSVCSCLGVTASTKTVPGSTTTQTFTVTSTTTTKETTTVTHITATATVTAETSAAPCRIKEVPGVNQDSGTSPPLYLTAPMDSDGLFVQTTAIIGDAWYWYLDNTVLKTVNTTVVPHGNSNNQINVGSKDSSLGNVICNQVGGLLVCHFVNAPTANIFVDAFDYVALYTPQEFAQIVSDSPLTTQANFQFDC